MTGPGTIYDLGYRPYEGPRLGRRGAVVAILWDGVARVLGLRRRFRAKLLPWLLLLLAVLPAVAFVGFSFLLSTFAPEVDSPFGGHAEYFDLVGTLALLFVSLAAPELLVPDRRHGVLALYGSRPLLPRDYLAARAGALTIVLSFFLLVPQLLLWVGFAALSTEGLVRALLADVGSLPKILAAAVVYVAGYGAPGLLLAGFGRRRAVVTGGYLALVLVGSGLAAAVTEAVALPGHRFAALGALVEHPIVVKDWIFGASNPSGIVGRAGFEPWVSALVITVLASAAGIVLVRRYRRLL